MDGGGDDGCDSRNAGYELAGILRRHVISIYIYSI